MREQHGNIVFIWDDSFFPGLAFELVFESKIYPYDTMGSLKCTFSTPARDLLIKHFRSVPMESPKACNACPGNSQRCRIVAEHFLSAWKNNATAYKDIEHEYYIHWKYRSRHGRPKAVSYCIVSFEESQSEPIFRWDPDCNPSIVIFNKNEYSKGLNLITPAVDDVLPYPSLREAELIVIESGQVSVIPATEEGIASNESEGDDFNTNVEDDCYHLLQREAGLIEMEAGKVSVIPATETAEGDDFTTNAEDVLYHPLRREAGLIEIEASQVSVIPATETSEGDDFTTTAEDEAGQVSVISASAFSRKSSEGDDSMTDTPVVDLRVYPMLRMLQEAETMCSMPASEDSEVDAFSCKASAGDDSMTDMPAVDVCCDSLQPEAFAIDAAPSFHVQCTFCNGPYKYQRNNKAVSCFLQMKCNTNCGPKRKHAWTYQCLNGCRNHHCCSFCMLDSGFVREFNKFNSSADIRRLAGDKQFGFYQPLKALHCLHIVSIAHDIFRERWPQIRISEIRCVDIGHGKGQMAMLMGRVFGCAVGIDVQRDMNKVVIAELSTYSTLSDRVLLMQCDLLRLGSFNG